MSSKSTNATPDNALPGGNPGPLLWYDQPSTAIEDLGMKDNATPKPLSEKRIEQLRELYRPGSHYRSGDIEGLLAYIDELKAQPAPVPLAEDEAVIADLEYIAQDEMVPGVPGVYARQILAASNRLSLRSGQLAKARSFIVRILVECGPGSHPGRTPEEAADEIIEGKK